MPNFGSFQLSETNHNSTKFHNFYPISYCISTKFHNFHNFFNFNQSSEFQPNFIQTLSSVIHVVKSSYGWHCPGQIFSSKVVTFFLKFGGLFLRNLCCLQCLLFFCWWIMLAGAGKPHFWICLKSTTIQHKTGMQVGRKNDKPKIPQNNKFFCYTLDIYLHLKLSQLRWLHFFTFQHCAFSNVSSNGLLERMHSHIGCIFLLFNTMRF